MGCFKNGHKRRNEAKTWRLFQQALCCNKAKHVYILQAGCQVPDLQLLWLNWQRIKSRWGSLTSYRMAALLLFKPRTLMNRDNVHFNSYLQSFYVSDTASSFQCCACLSSVSPPPVQCLGVFCVPLPRIISPSSLHHYLIIHTSFFINIYLQSAGFRYKAAAPPLLITSDKAE